MKRMALALTALTAVTIALAPASYAAPDFDELRQENLDKGAVNFDELRRENLEKDAAEPGAPWYEKLEEGVGL